MNAAEIVLLKTSWQELYSNSATTLFVEQFYDNLISEYPSVLVLFPSIRVQSVAFAGVLSLAISSLDNIEVLDDYLVRLGKRHGRIIGVEVVHFEMVGNALLDTLRNKLGSNMTIELESAWIRLYSYLANRLLESVEDDFKPVEQPKPTVVPIAVPVAAKPPMMTLGIPSSPGINGTNSTPSANAATERRKPSMPLATPMPPSNTTSNFTHPESSAYSAINFSGMSHPPSGQFNIKQRKRKADSSKNKECSVM